MCFTAVWLVLRVLPTCLTTEQYVDKVSKKIYYAVEVTGSTSDWVALN